jgi:diguanylate cyclase (GGDEF)-like protein
MVAAPLPSNEAERLAALRSYDVLDTICEASFDNITQMAAQLTGCPISLVSLVDSERQWFKSKVGLDATETPREQSFCAHAITNSSEALVVGDALLDARFSDNPLVSGAPSIRFYAGVPLVNSEGLALGTLCVIDREPRKLSQSQSETLQRLAGAVMTTLELRRAMIRVRSVAVIDSLTGIANRVALLAAIETAIARCDRHGTSFLLLYLDLDGFKCVNDTLGHAAGDRVLQVVASILTACLRNGDIVGRLGGDEFALVLAGGESDVEGATERVRAEIEKGAAAHGWAVGASIGAVAFTQAPGSADVALAIADRLMYADKLARKTAPSCPATPSELVG